MTNNEGLAPQQIWRESQSFIVWAGGRAVIDLQRKFWISMDEWLGCGGTVQFAQGGDFFLMALA